MSEICFRPWGDYRWLLQKHPEKDWIAIACVATERRSVDSILDLSRRVRWMSVISINDPDPFDEREQETALTQSINDVKAQISCAATYHHDELKSSMDDIKERVLEAVAKSSNIILDITCFPKRWFFPMLRFLTESAHVRNLFVVYTQGEGYAQQISENYEVLRPIQGFASWAGRVDHDIAFIGVGFHAISMLTMFGDDRPKGLRLLFPFPPGPPGLKRNWRFVQYVEQTMKFDESLSQQFKPLDVMQLSAVDASQAFDAMRAVSLSGARTSLIAPYGPKPISLAMCLFALAADAKGASEVPAYYAQPQRYAVDYTARSVVRDGVVQTLGYAVKNQGLLLYKL